MQGDRLQVTHTHSEAHPPPGPHVESPGPGSTQLEPQTFPTDTVSLGIRKTSVYSKNTNLQLSRLSSPRNWGGGGWGEEEAELGSSGPGLFIFLSALPPTALDQKGGVRVYGSVGRLRWGGPGSRGIGVWRDTPTSSPPRTSPHYGLFEIRGLSPRAGAK